MLNTILNCVNQVKRSHFVNTIIVELTKDNRLDEDKTRAFVAVAIIYRLMWKNSDGFIVLQLTYFGRIRLIPSSV